MKNNYESFFSNSYSEARSKFREACKERNIDVTVCKLPNELGADGEELYVDVAYIGKADAPNIVLFLSGVHGVEGFCGSGIQVGLIREFDFNNLPNNVGILFVHAINPYGFSHLRRVNENNIDLNRNFQNFINTPSMNAAYEEIHPYVLPEKWVGPKKETADAKIDQFILERGERCYQNVFTQGQYHHPNGVYFGGNSETWSNLTLIKIIQRYVSPQSHLAVVDFHTGLGPSGYGEPIHNGNATSLARAQYWYGDDVTSTALGNSNSSPVTGTIERGLKEALPDGRLTYIALEFGTFPIQNVLHSLRADNWLYVYGMMESETASSIKKQIRDAFYCDNDEWKRSVWQRGNQIAHQCIQGVSR